MRNKFLYTFREDLNERLKDPKFKKAWREAELEYLLAKELIEKRVAKKLSQRRLARKANTTQAMISRLETMRANPSLAFLKRVAEALDSKLLFQFK